MNVGEAHAGNSGWQGPSLLSHFEGTALQKAPVACSVSLRSRGHRGLKLSFQPAVCPASQRRGTPLRRFLSCKTCLVQRPNPIPPRT